MILRNELWAKYIRGSRSEALDLARELEVTVKELVASLEREEETIKQPYPYQELLESSLDSSRLVETNNAIERITKETISEWNRFVEQFKQQQEEKRATKSGTA